MSILKVNTIENNAGTVSHDVADLNKASSVQFQLDATGAVNRDVQSKLAESVSVKDFGAVGMG